MAQIFDKARAGKAQVQRWLLVWQLGDDKQANQKVEVSIWKYKEQWLLATKAMRNKGATE